MVNFVGAGPGAADLITVRGMRLLEQADVIIYAGSLVSEKLLEGAKKDCQIYNSAKMSLDEVIEVMEEADKKGLSIVRLHTGDPSLYGAIREQMDRLDARHISYEVVPGVSSFCGAAATLQAEYTLPGVSQSVIITRMEGRTKVPELEKISSFARHKATMVIFLSASMTDLVAKELMAGGYEPETPAAIVYKASWPEEKVVRCTVGTLHQCAKAHQITNHALLTVGYFLGNDYELSKLYDASFSTGYRGTSRKETLKVSLLSFSDKGEKMAEQIVEILTNSSLHNNECKGDAAIAGCRVQCIEESCNERVEDGGNESVEDSYKKGIGTSLSQKQEIEKSAVEIVQIHRCESGELDAWTATHFRKDDALIFVGACGIATRAIAPYIQHKTVDPAVIVVDELGKNVIPLLSGHIGGANQLSETIAAGLGVAASITTATDINDVFSIDTWATRKHMLIVNPEAIKKVSTKMLRREKVYINSEIKLTDFPEQVIGQETRPHNVMLSQQAKDDDVMASQKVKDCDAVVSQETGAGKVVAKQEEKSCDVVVSYRKDTCKHVGLSDEKKRPLLLIPPVLSVGIGCKKGTSVEEIERIFSQVFSLHNLDSRAVKCICSIDLKKGEPGLIEFANRLGCSFMTFSAKELKTLDGTYATSDFVKAVAGVDCVCERSAVMGAGQKSDACLLVRKTAENGVTIAVALQDEL